MVLQLLKDEEVDMVLHSGDLDYTGRAEDFFQSVDDVLGRNFPYFISMGNYESKEQQRGGGSVLAWAAYERMQRERLERIPDLACSVVSSRNLACSFHGVSFVTSAIGANFSRLGLDLKELKDASSELWGKSHDSRTRELKPTWRFCSWHIPLNNFQVGFRAGVPWMSSPQLLEAYESCRAHGAVILNGHEHYYLRSRTIKRFSLDPTKVKYERILRKSVTPMQLSNASRRSVVERVEQIEVGPGSTFMAISGLGGHSVSIPSLAKQRQTKYLALVHPAFLAEEREIPGKYFYPNITTNLHTATVVTSSEQINVYQEPEQGYPFGALICVLQNTAQSTARGHCYFKTIRGRIVDRFNLVRFY